MTPSVKHDNRIISALPRAERRKLLAVCEVVSLCFEQRLHSRDEAVSFAYFPTSAIICEWVCTERGQSIEICLTGREGMLGLHLMLKEPLAPFEAVVQNQGEVLRCARKDFLRVLRSAPKLQRLLQRYTYVAWQQIAQNVSCSHFHAIEERLARWLLMTQDRAVQAQFSVTHEFLSHLLGASRVSITNAASILKKNRLIYYSRGEMQILDREGLLAISCSCYAKDFESY